MFPIPDEMRELLLKMSAWLLGLILSGIGALIVIMLKQFLTGQSTLKLRVDSFELSVKNDLKVFNESLLTIAREMANTSKEIASDAAEIKQANMDFQQSVAQDLLNIKKETLDIEKSIGKTHVKAEELDAKFDSTANKIDELYRRIETHDKAMSAASNVIREHHNALARSKADMMKVKKKVTALSLLKRSTKSLKSA